MKRKVKMQLALTNKSAIRFDGEGGGQIKFDFDATQTALVAEMLLAGDMIIEAVFEFDTDKEAEE